MSKELIAAKFFPIILNPDPLSAIGMCFWPWVEADRFDILNKESPYNFIVDKSKPLPSVNNKNTDDMRTICLNRATDIINKARKENKKILVFWSGGVDSTCILASLLIAGVKKDELTILYTDNSIQENPITFLKLKKNKYNFIKYNWDKSIEFYNSLGTNALFVIGWCADQLFGSNVNLRYPDLYNVNWKMGLKKIISDSFHFRGADQYNDKKILNGIIEEYEDYTKKIGIDLRYTCDALWSFNFCVKWSHVSRDLSLTMENEEQKRNIITFYEPIPFQEWSLNNYRDFYKHNQTLDVKNYKRPLKEIIYEAFKDEDYLNEKGKVGSWKSTTYSVNINTYGNLQVLDKDGYHIYKTKQIIGTLEYLTTYLKDSFSKKDNIDIHDTVLGIVYDNLIKN